MQSTKPFFSIIIPTLNEEKYLPILLKSFTPQTDRDFEVLVVDGMSVDATIAKAKLYSAKLPRLTIIQTKKGLPHQRNVAAKHAKGHYLVFIDADSVVLPNFVERLREFVKRKKPSVFTVWPKPDGETQSDVLLTLFYSFILEGSLVIKRHFTPGPLTIVKRSAFEAIGGYDVSHEYNEDMDLGLRLHKAGYQLMILRETLFIWSLRRFRREGTLKILNQYLFSALVVLLRNKPLKRLPGYVMGGQMYEKKQPREWQAYIEDWSKKIHAYFDELTREW